VVQTCAHTQYCSGSDLCTYAVLQWFRPVHIRSIAACLIIQRFERSVKNAGCFKNSPSELNVCVSADRQTEQFN